LIAFITHLHGVHSPFAVVANYNTKPENGKGNMAFFSPFVGKQWEARGSKCVAQGGLLRRDDSRLAAGMLEYAPFGGPWPG